MAMRDVTELMNVYRECSRNLWNVYFSKRENVGHSLDTYEPIRKLLFDSLVVDELVYLGSAQDLDIPPPALRVVPTHTAQILIEAVRSPGEATYWGEARDLYVNSDDIKLAYIDYFDFSNLSARDFQYYLCKILSFPPHVEYEGRRALIQASDGTVFHDEEHDDDPPAATL
jgi:hypothetical protein